MNLTVYLMLEMNGDYSFKLKPDALYYASHASKATRVWVQREKENLKVLLDTCGWKNMDERRQRIESYFTLIANMMTGDCEATGKEIDQVRQDAAKATRESMGYAMSSVSDTDLKKPFRSIDDLAAQLIANRIISKKRQPKS